MIQQVLRIDSGRLQCRSELGRAGEPMGRVLLQGAQEHGAKPRRRFGRWPGRVVRHSVRDLH
jgi:hypothetical protein